MSSGLLFQYSGIVHYLQSQRYQGEGSYSETPDFGPSNLGQKKDRTSLISDFQHSAGNLLVKLWGCRNNDVNFWEPRRNSLQWQNVTFGSQPR